MINFIRKLLSVAVLALGLTATTFAAPTAQFPYREIESWQGQGMVFVIRNAEGQIMHHAKGHLEKWKSEKFQVWVVRDAKGRFLTYMHGALERWADGTLRLVLRNKEGKFVAVATVAFVNGKRVVMPAEQVERVLPLAA
jgi:hypothetical protein